MSSSIFTTENQFPLVPAGVSFPSFTFFPLDIKAVTDGDLAFLSGEGFKAALTLMAQSWRETPAASLPDDDRRLAAFAGFGRGPAADTAWAAVKDEALSDFTLCSDGRWYSRTLAVEAIRAWRGVEGNRARTAEATKARLAKLGKTKPDDMPTVTSHVTSEVTDHVTSTRGEERRREETIGQEKRSEERSSTLKGGGVVKGGAGGAVRSATSARPRRHEDFRGDYVTIKGDTLDRYAKAFPALAINIHGHLHAIDRDLRDVPENNRGGEVQRLLRNRNEAAVKNPEDLPF